MTRSPALPRVLALLACLWLALVGVAAVAQTFPPLTGRVVDAAHVLPAATVAQLEQQLAALQTQSQRQLVVATIPDLQGYDIADYGYRLGRAWALGDKKRNDGIVLIVAPKEHKVRIEVGYGLEPIITDGLSEQIIANTIVPKFKAGDIPGGIVAGTAALIQQLTLPADQAAQIAASARPSAAADDHGSSAMAFIMLGCFALFFLWRTISAMRRFGRYRSSGGGLGPVALWSAFDAMSSSGGGSDSSSSSDSFSGDGGSFGGGGASGSW